MKLVLYFTDTVFVEAHENEGFHPLRVMAALQRLKEADGIEVEAIDVSEWTRDKVNEAYTDAVRASYTNRYAIRKVFGTNTSSASFFGHGVPALLVYEDDMPRDVFPHRDGAHGIVTIRDYLDELLGENGEGARLIEQMDKLRRTIGVVGTTTSELVREGRRR